MVLATPLVSSADTEQDLKDAYQMIRDGKYEEALAKYRDIRDSDQSPDVQHKCLFWSGIALECLGRNDEAIGNFEALTDVAPEFRWSEVLNKLAVRYRAKGDTATSDAYISQMLERRKGVTDPKEAARADLLIGDCLKLKADWPAALEHYRKMQPLYPEHAEDILFHIGATAHAAKQYDASLQAYREYMGKYGDKPRFEEVALRVMEVYRDAGKPSEAVAHLDRIASEYPNLRGRALIAKCEILADSLGNASASTDLADALAAENSDPYIVYLAKYRAAVNDLYYKRDAGSARAKLVEIVDLYPKDHLAVEIAHDIAFSYYQQGDYLTAAERYLHAIAKYPCPVPSWDALTRYMAGHSYSLAGDRVEAKRVWDDLARRHPDSSWTRQARMEEEAWTNDGQ
jgi:TolA-binding protein